MKRHRLAMFVLSSVLLTASSASAVSIGTNLGFTHYLPSSGDGLSLLAVPNSGNFGLFAPGLRITQPLGTDGRQSIYFDGGLVYMSLSGDNAHTLGLLAGYQYTFSEAASAPYVTVGVGLNSSGGTGVPSTTNPVIGGGVGVLHRLPHGKGALRAELHLDREIDTDNSEASITGIGLKLGFDLDL
jgi:hypothetical protein